ncbi:hypothetical protein CMV_020561 [Castanea mollissima]|uniref:argininosuccinate synthase n=1 Tax=Castanea mollissima TaxID=60419 RepID=A0A8J4R0Q6_9ROSI|nr:hypothetical protein CMV_020561 [Castanea mollissima]
MGCLVESLMEKVGIGLGPKQSAAHSVYNLRSMTTSPGDSEAGECSNTYSGPFSSTSTPNGSGEKPTVFPNCLVMPVEMSRSDFEGSFSVSQLQVASQVGALQTDADGGIFFNKPFPCSRENNGCDVGQGIGELEGLEVKAKASDASQLVVKDLEEFGRNSIFLCSRVVAIDDRKYLLGNSMACPVIEKGDILDPANKPKKDMNMLTLDPEEALETPEYIEVGIEPGLPVSVMARNGKVLPPASLLVELNEIGGKHGIGQIDMVENQLVGMKGCGVYETLGGTILFATATVQELESLTID